MVGIKENFIQTKVEKILSLVNLKVGEEFRMGECTYMNNYDNLYKFDENLMIRHKYNDEWLYSPDNDKLLRQILSDEIDIIKIKNPQKKIKLLFHM